MEKCQHNRWQLAGGLPYLILGERHLTRMLREYVAYFNRDRPPQGLAQATPEPQCHEVSPDEGPVRVTPILGGLHHAYRRAA